MRSVLILPVLALLAGPVLAQTAAAPEAKPVGVTTTAPPAKPAQTPAGTPTDGSAPAMPAAAPAAKPAAKTAAKPAIDMAGAYVFGAEVSTFQPCGEPKTYWLDAPEAVADVLQANARAVSERAAPYSPIFVRISATEAEAEGAFPKDYDGALELVTLEDLAWTLPADCPLPKAP